MTKNILIYIISYGFYIFSCTMNKFNLPMLWIWLVIAISATAFTHLTNNTKQTFETQSVRTTRSLWIQASNQSKEYCKVAFNPLLPDIDEAFTVTVDWVIKNGLTINTFVKWPSLRWWWTNNFSWFPTIITEAKSEAWTYVYIFTIQWENTSITCEWTLIVWKQNHDDKELAWLESAHDVNSDVKPEDKNTAWNQNQINNNAGVVHTTQPRSLRQ